MTCSAPVHHLGSGVLVLARTGERDGQGLALGVLAHQVDRRVFHRHLGADVAVHPLHGRAGVRDGALGDQVVDVVRPVLDRRVPAPRALLHDDLDHRGVQRVRGVDRRGAALDIVHVGVLVDDDQGPLELAHVLGVDPEVSLQRDLHPHALRHVDERPAGPDGRVQRGELVVPDRDHRREILPEHLRVLPQRRVGVQEKTPFSSRSSRILWYTTSDSYCAATPRDQALLLRLGDAEPVVGVLDVRRQVIPAGRLLLGRAHEVLDVVEVDPRQVRAPRRHRLAVEQLQAAQPQV